MINTELYQFNSICAQTKITGDIEFEHSTNIFGQLIGNIKVNTDDILIIFDGAKIEGDIHCHDIEIQGIVSGNIYSRGKVTLKSSAVVDGSIESKTLVVYPGSELNIKAHCE